MSRDPIVVNLPHKHPCLRSQFNLSSRTLHLLISSLPHPSTHRLTISPIHLIAHQRLPIPAHDSHPIEIIFSPGGCLPLHHLSQPSCDSSNENAQPLRKAVRQSDTHDVPISPTHHAWHAARNFRLAPSREHSWAVIGRMWGEGFRRPCGLPCFSPLWREIGRAMKHSRWLKSWWKPWISRCGGEGWCGCVHWLILSRREVKGIVKVI